ncbi:MAG: DUF4132 domain-containing protein, partial [Deltaproteobacteria bacterium]
SDATLRCGRSIGEAPRAALVEMLQVSPLDRPYAGLAIIREVCSDESPARLARELLEQWVLGDLPGRHEWMLFASAHFPSVEGTRRIISLAREWARKNAPKASRLCVALAAIGSDAALMALAHIADTTRYAALAKEVRALVEGVAEGRGLTRDELGDRTVPDLGLDAGGTLSLSFGARAFEVGLDETLSAVVREKLASGLGPPSALFPRAQKTDDAALAKAARERFDALKSDLAAVAQRQLRRLERAMVEGRAWTPADFREHLAGHPLMGRLARRLVWEAAPERGRSRTFRVAEDGSLADKTDHAFSLDGEDMVRLAHPARTPAVSTVWAKVFGDYEFIQPFEQIARVVHALDAGERAATSLARAAGTKVAPKKMLGVLESRGWVRDSAGYVTAFTREVRRRDGARLTARLSVTPEIEIADLRRAGNVETGALTVESPGEGTAVALGELDVVSSSELWADVLALSRSSRD